MIMPDISAEDRHALLQSLRAGVVPARGLEYMQVGREDELEAVLADIDTIANGGGAFRIVVGEYGSGKSFFQAMIRNAAAQHRNIVTIHADITGTKRLQGSSGEARQLYVELIKNMHVHAGSGGVPTGLEFVLEQFVVLTANKAAFDRNAAKLRAIGAHDFAHVLHKYWEASRTGRSDDASDATEWFRGNVGLRRDAARTVGVNTILTNGTFYDQLKALALLVQMAGFRGLLVCVDELAELRNLQKPSRETNFAQIRQILNDCLSGPASGIGFLFCSLPKLVDDPQFGLASDEGMRQRLHRNFTSSEFSGGHQGPVITLKPLTEAEVQVLLRGLQKIHGTPLTNAGIAAFVRHCTERVGNVKHRTTRSLTQNFIYFLDTLKNNPGASWQKLLGEHIVRSDDGTKRPQAASVDDDDDAPPFTM